MALSCYYANSPPPALSFALLYQLRNTQYPSSTANTSDLSSHMAYALALHPDLGTLTSVSLLAQLFEQVVAFFAIPFAEDFRPALVLLLQILARKFPLLGDFLVRARDASCGAGRRTTCRLVTLILLVTAVVQLQSRKNVFASQSARAV